MNSRWLGILFVVSITTRYRAGPVPPAPQPTSEDTGAGIIFNKVKTIILADQYEHVTFLLPFPSLVTKLSSNLSEATNILHEYWNAIPGDCPELHDRVVEDTQAAELVMAATDAYQRAETDLELLATELTQLLTPPQEQTRRPRFAMVAAAAIGAGVMYLGSQLGDGCIAGILGPCETEKNVAANRDVLNEAIQRLGEQQLKWTALSDNLDEKFYVIGSDLKELHQTQNELAQSQWEFWNATSTTLDGLTTAVKTMTICTEYLFARSQMNLLRTTILARVQTMLSSLQAFRVALWAYRSTLLDAIPGLSHGYLPMSLVSRDTLIQILERTSSGQAHNEQHLTLALGLTHLLRYYETPLVRRVESSPDGILITMAVPLTTREMVMQVYEAIPLPMPATDEEEPATQWAPETKYIAITTNHKENALLTDDHLRHCVGHEDAAICQQGFATTRNRDSCLATLFFHGAEEAMATCKIVQVELPRVEAAKHLGYGRWLITRQDPNYALQLLSGDPQRRLQESQTRIPGCRACIIILACGTELESDNLFLKADSSSCNATGARRLELTLAPPLADLFRHLPLTAALPDFQTHSAARLTLFRQVQAALPMPTDHAAGVTRDRLHLIAAPMASVLTQEGTQLTGLQHIRSASWLLQMAIVCSISLIISLLVQVSLTVCAYRRALKRMVKKSHKPLIPVRRTGALPTDPKRTGFMQTPSRPITPRFSDVSDDVEVSISPADRLAVLCAAVNQRLVPPAATVPTPEYSTSHRL